MHKSAKNRSSRHTNNSASVGVVHKIVRHVQRFLSRLARGFAWPVKVVGFLLSDLAGFKGIDVRPFDPDTMTISFFEQQQADYIYMYVYIVGKW